MELGNMCFGNSRGSYSVDRELQEGFYSFLEVMGFDGHGYKNGHDEWVFENDVFRVQPYYWGDCQCGFEGRAEEWHEANPHGDDCYQTELRQMEIEAGIHYTCDDRLEYDEYRKIQDKIYAGLMDKHNKPREGCAVHCTCYKEAAADKWFSENDHAKDCLIATPNFTFKPTALEISWYKYPLRDSYSNQEFTREMMHEIMPICVQSLSHPLTPSSI